MLLRYGSKRLPKPEVTCIVTDAWMPTSNDFNRRHFQTRFKYFDVKLPPADDPLGDEGNKIIRGEQLEQHGKAWPRHCDPALMADRGQCFVGRAPETASCGMDEQMIELAELSD